jgi:hypothetical protein
MRFPCLPGEGDGLVCQLCGPVRESTAPECPCRRTPCIRGDDIRTRIKVIGVDLQKNVRGGQENAGRPERESGIDTAAMQLRSECAIEDQAAALSKQ